MKRFATAATLALAATTTFAAPAIAKTETFDELMVISTPPPPIQLSLSKSVLFNDSSHVETDHFVQVAGARTRKRRTRIANPRRRTVAKHRVVKPRFKTTGRKNGTNAPAPLNCYNQSHPDCANCENESHQQCHQKDLRAVFDLEDDFAP